MSDHWDVVIIGAGIVGSACALECASRGMRTAVVEGKGIASGATAAGMGHIVVMDDSPAQMALTHYSQTLWKGLSDRLPANVEYETVRNAMGGKRRRGDARRFDARAPFTLPPAFLP